ncbi:hypothetical protein SB775_15365 [Peribacillus sp. SIMBA_075]|uniref:hypothetical protein n=1 Tax=Peribacillus sp. SIMBA_075 TaxID=3085813 RepID=UPI0039782C66
MHKVENIQGFVHLYIFSTYSHKNKYFHLVTNYKIEPKTKRFTSLKKQPLMKVIPQLKEMSRTVNIQAGIPVGTGKDGKIVETLQLA